MKGHQRGYTGTVNRLYPTMDAATHTFNVEVTVPNSRRELRPGMYARVTVNFGDSFNITVNAENPVIRKIMGETGVKALTADNTLLKQATDLALLSNGMLKGKALADFIKRSEELLG